MENRVYDLGIRPAFDDPIEYLIFDHGYSVKIHMKPTDTREKIVWELQQLLKIYKGNVEDDSVGK